MLNFTQYKTIVPLTFALFLVACGGSDDNSTAPIVEPIIEPTVVPTPEPKPEPEPVAGPVAKSVGECFIANSGDKVDPVGENSQISMTYRVNGEREVCVTAGSVSYTAGA